MENLTKPRLAEVLGMEVGQKWRVECREESINSVEVYMNENGQLIGVPAVPAVVGASILLTAINHPECIICTKRLTEPELAICKATGAKWVSMSRITIGKPIVSLWDKKPMFDGLFYFVPEDDENNIVEGTIGTINQNLFPSVQPGDCICVEEVSSE